MKDLMPFNFKKWIDENREFLKPPVGNRRIWADRETTVMVVGGPNKRTDYHVNQGEEFFYQIEGDMTLRILIDGKPHDIPITEGDIFLLPPKVPHSPQRPADTVGLVIENPRRTGEKDELFWLCDECGTEVYREKFEMINIETQFKDVFGRYYGNEQNRTCQKCGHKNSKN